MGNYFFNRCPNSAEITLPHTEIQLNLLPQLRDDGKLVGADASVDNQHRSVWVDEASYPHPVERTLREHRAMGQSLSEEPGDEPPILMIQGSDVIITEPSIGEEGIPLFPDLEFQLPEQEMRAGINAQLHAAAAAVPLEDCLVWIVSTEDLLNSSRGTDLHQSEDERIDWPVDLVVQLGLSGTNDKHGVKLHGRKPAGYYESLLRTFHYFPPREIRTSDEANKPDPREANVRYVATVGLMCSTDAGQHMTNQFSVKVVLESPEYIEQDLSGNRAIQKLSPKTIDATPIRTQLNKGRRPRRNGSRTIREAELQNVPPVRPETRSHVSSVVVGTLVVVSATLVLLTVALVVFVRKKTWRRKVRSSDSVEHPRRRRFPSKPADFGGSSLKFDPTLRLTANPIGEMEYVGLGTVKENMYGSSRDLAATQCIFSPPSMDPYSEEGIVRLAGLEEFDEDYADEASEELYNEDVSQDHVQELNDGEVLQNSTDCSELENSTHEDGLAPRCSSHLEASQSQVHDWPGEQEAATDRLPFVADPNKC
ncbi:unnamed protein product [Dicrocoelium dendriticum]|nr:unnamed protein product [Dicrocoelium dendriticum]